MGMDFNGEMHPFCLTAFMSPFQHTHGVCLTVFLALVPSLLLLLLL
jgi:hypothetical protein